jgi:predicted kinase
MSKTLILLVGPSGSGKSTLAQSMVSDSYICEADTYQGLYTNGKINPSLLETAHKECQSRVKALMKERTPVIVQSNTNLDLGERGILPYLNIAIIYGYQVTIILPQHGLLHFPYHPSIDMQIEHLIRSREKGDKIIPESVINRMVKTYSELSKTYQHLATFTNPKDMVFFLNKKMK